MQHLDKFYINGAWVHPASSDRMAILNPATEQQIGTVAMGNAQDVDRAVEAARLAFESFSTTSKSDRLGLLQNLLSGTKARLEDLAQAMSQEMGAPISMSREAQADAAIGRAADGGFWGLALRRCPAGLLTDLPWSQPTTYVATRNRLRAQGLRVVELPPWWDVDEEADLRRLVATHAAAAPATAAVAGRVLA